MLEASLQVLLVDDNATNLKILERTLRHHFSHLIDCSTMMTANDGFEALAKLEVRDFDLILLDIDMPGLSGVQVAQEIRKSDLDTIIIACTTSDSAEQRNLYDDVGMDDCVVKPLDLRELNAALDSSLRSREYLNIFNVTNSPTLPRFLMHATPIPKRQIDSRPRLDAGHLASMQHVPLRTDSCRCSSLSPEIKGAEFSMTTQELDLDCSPSISPGSDLDEHSTFVSRGSRSISSTSSDSACACFSLASDRRARLLSPSASPGQCSPDNLLAASKEDFDLRICRT